MGLIQATIETLASVLGCRQDQAEDVVHSTASARAAMSRRGFFRAAGAVAAGVVMLDAAPAEAAAPGYFRGIDHPSSRLQSWDVILKKHYTTEPVSASDEYRGSDGSLWRFQDDTRELMAAHAVVKAVDRENGIIHYDTVGPGAHSVTLLRPDLAMAYDPGDIISRKQAVGLLGK